MYKISDKEYRSRSKRWQVLTVKTMAASTSLMMGRERRQEIRRRLIRSWCLHSPSPGDPDINSLLVKIIMLAANVASSNTINNFRSKSCFYIWGNLHCQQLLHQSVPCKCAGPAPGQNTDADADLLLNLLLQVTDWQYYWMPHFLFWLQITVPVAGSHKSEAAHHTPGRHVISNLHHCALRCLLHASPWRSLHCVLLPCGHHHTLSPRAQGDGCQCHDSNIWNFQDRLGTSKIIAALLLLSGVVLVCKPPFLFHSLSHKARMSVSISRNATSRIYLQTLWPGCWVWPLLCWINIGSGVLLLRRCHECRRL